MSAIRRFWLNGGKIKVIVSVLSFIIGFFLAYTRSIVWGVNLYRDIQDLKAFKYKTEVVLEALQENVIRLCEKQGIEPVRPSRNYGSTN